MARRPKWRGPGNQNMPRRPRKENDSIKLFINSCAYSPTQAAHAEAGKLNSTIDNYPVTRKTIIWHTCKIDKTVKEIGIESQHTEGCLELTTEPNCTGCLLKQKCQNHHRIDRDKESHSAYIVQKTIQNNLTHEESGKPQLVRNNK